MSKGPTIADIELLANTAAYRREGSAEVCNLRNLFRRLRTARSVRSFKLIFAVGEFTDDELLVRVVWETARGRFTMP